MFSYSLFTLTRFISERKQLWKAGHDAPIFSRIILDVPKQSDCHGAGYQGEGNYLGDISVCRFKQSLTTKVSIHHPFKIQGRGQIHRHTDIATSKLKVRRGEISMCHNSAKHKLCPLFRSDLALTQDCETFHTQDLLEYCTYS